MAARFAVFSPAFYVDDPPIQRLKHSCMTHDVPLFCYGVGRVYQPHGIMSHISEFANILESHAEPIVMLTDAFDSWLLAGEEEILAKFAYCRSNILVSGERDCWPVASIREQFPPASTPYRWLNAGGMMGYRLTLVQMCRELVKRYGDGPGEMQGNPQGLWSRGYVDGVHKDLGISVGIDHDCAIFQTMSAGADGDLVYRSFNPDTNRACNMTTRAFPCVLHHNGRCGDNSAVEKTYQKCYPGGETVREELRR